MARVQRGVVAALGSAALFGLSTPVAKGLLGSTGPLWVAGLLYAGSGLGLLVWRAVRRCERARLTRSDAGWLALAVGAGGVVAPVLLLTGLAAMPAGSAALLLNTEAVATVLIAWAVFREHIGRRIATGAAFVVAGMCVLAGSPHMGTGARWWAPVLVVTACIAWAVDNNATGMVEGIEASWIAMVKGLVAGGVNLVLALAVGQHAPGAGTAIAAMVAGVLGYGVSLVLYVFALRRLGAARAGAYFGVAPFVGAVAGIVAFSQPVTWQLAAAGILMAVGVWLHLSEHHVHEHLHEVGGLGMVHSHPHFPDREHRHEH